MLTYAIDPNRSMFLSNSRALRSNMHIYAKKGIFCHHPCKPHRSIIQFIFSGVAAIPAPTPRKSTIVFPVCTTPPNFSP
jgi:hypothetical protein